MDLQFIYRQALFFFSTLTWLGIVDLILVTAVFYLLLNLLSRNPAAFLLRQTLALAAILLVITILLPLPAFDWLAQGVLVAILIATPIIFQIQIRRFLERVGRTVGLAQAMRQGTLESLLPSLTHAVETMATTRTGALLVLEGNDALDDIIKSGILCEGLVTSELLLSIFYSGTPLHDGAVIIRSDRVTAAGCVLPLTQQSLEADKRLGTRHRAAVGLSEHSDALTIVVSEETGQISVARQGQLNRPLTIAALREELLDYFDPATFVPPTLSLWRLLRQAGRGLWRAMTQASLRQVLSNLSLLLIALLLALVIWSFAFERTNPSQLARVEGIPLRVENLPADSQPLSPLPATVSAVIQTTEDVLPTLSPSRSFQAVASLKEKAPGVYRLPVQVSASIPQVFVRSVEPPILDLQLVPIISRTLAVTVHTPDQSSLSTAYELVNGLSALPDQVQVTGPAPLVEQVSQLRASISVASANTTLREIRPLVALNEQEREVSGITLQPDRVQVTVPIRRRLNARDVGIQAIVQGTPPAGYWLSNLSVNPTSITLQGSPAQLLEIGGFINTLAIDISQATGDLSQQVPLDLPAEIQALDSQGNVIETVTVLAQISVRQGDLAVTRSVELLRTPSTITITVQPVEIDLLLSGPLPTLNEIEAQPDLVQVVVDRIELSPGQRVDVTPTVIAPAGIQAQLVPPSVSIRAE